MSYGGDMLAGYELGSKIRDRFKTGKSEFEHELERRRREDERRNAELAEAIEARKSGDTTRAAQLAEAMRANKVREALSERGLTGDEKERERRAALEQRLQGFREDEAYKERMDAIHERTRRAGREFDDYMLRQGDQALRRREIEARTNRTPDDYEESTRMDDEGGEVRTRRYLPRGQRPPTAAPATPPQTPAGTPGAGMPPPAQPEERVRVVGRDGRPYTMPRKNWPAAQARGYRLLKE